MSNENRDAFVKSIPTPEGFTRNEGPGYSCDDGGASTMATEDDPCIHVELSDGRRRIIFNVTKHDPNLWPEGQTVSVSGHTHFKDQKDHWRSFSRRGVEDSFYRDDNETPEEIIEKQLARCDKAMAREGGFLDIPGLPFRIHKDKLQARSETFQSGKSYAFMPSGFGIGYKVSTRKSRWNKRMPQATSDFFSCGPLYVEKLDCD